MRHNRKTILAWATAVAGPGIVTLLAFTSTGPLAPALLYVLAIGLAALVGGLAPGLVSGGLSFVGLHYFFVMSKHGFGPLHAADVAGLVVFALTAVIVTEFIARLRRARATALDAAERASRLQRAADALSVAVTPYEVLDAVTERAVQAVEARAGMIALLVADGTELEVVAQRGYDESVIAPWQRFPVDAPLPLSEAVRTGEPVFLGSRKERDARYPDLASVPGHALVCLPLIVERRAIGGLVFSFGEDQDFSSERREVKVALARQAAQALDRARLFEAERSAAQRLGVVARASELLSGSLEHEETFRRLVRAVVPVVADWCTIDFVGPDGAIERLAVAHEDPTKIEWARELQERYPPDPDAPTGVANVIRTGVPEFLPVIPDELLEASTADDPELAGIVAQLGIRSWICVPLRARGETIGALSLVTAESGRTYTEADLELAIDLASRAGIAVDNARLYSESERRAEAARALHYVGDAVVLVDANGVVRYWNPAATALTGQAEAEAVGRPLDELVEGWHAVSTHVREAGAAGELAPSTTIPLGRGDDERWLSVTAVDFGDGVVYALRDVSEERAFEQARADFVATASHELRTPLAAVYGAARTLLREDVEIGPENRTVFLRMIEQETARLTGIVNQILLAGELAGGDLRTDDTACDLREIVADVVDEVRIHAPEEVRLDLRESDGLPAVRCDPERLRQVLLNLLDNAVKYSPDGGDVDVELRADDDGAQILVRDRGLGIPAVEQERIFERFYRLDPSLTRGVGGSGLGLYISRELVRRMGGSLSVESELGEGSVFTVELPVG